MKNILKSLKFNESTVSNVLSILVFVLVGALLFNYFKSVNKVNSGKVTDTAATTETQKVAQASPEATVKQVVEQGLPSEYVIKKGDSLWKIAEQAYGDGFMWTKIYEANKTNISNPSSINADTKITLPKIEAETIEYTVVSGDNMWNIASSQCHDGFMWQSIAEANHISNPRLIEPGLKLQIRCR